MKGAILICFFALVAITLARPNEQYTDKFDNINVDEILANKRLLGPYVKCALGQGKCTPEGNELKSHIEDALKTDCAKCTDVQKKGTTKVIGHLINNEPQSWEQLKAKYDPSGQYSKKHEEELRKAKA